MPRLCGAGILPYIECGGVVYFLLGKERFVDGWRGSCKLSAFEGGNKAPEDDVSNATREFIEESLGVLVSTNADEQKLKEELYTGEYAMKVYVHCAQRNEQHLTYVKRFASGADVVSDFNLRRAALVHIHTLSKEMAECLSHIPERYPFIFPGDHLTDVHGRTARVERVAARKSAAFVVVECTFVGTVGMKRLCVAFSRQVEMYVRALELHAELETLLVSVDARAVAKRARGNVHVCDEWLEKSSVQLVTLSQLEYLVNQRRDSLRPFFRMVATQVVSQFRNPSAPRNIVEVHDEL